jgi:hypothetical protein
VVTMIRDLQLLIELTIAKKYDLSKIAIEADEQCIPADYLINNIEQSFDLWQNSPWVKCVNFYEKNLVNGNIFMYFFYTFGIGKSMNEDLIQLCHL